MGKFISGVTTGAVIGAAVGMMVVPQLDWGTRKKIKKSSKIVKSLAGDLYGNMMKMNR